MPRPILDVVSEFFDSDGWKMEPVDGIPALRVPFSGSTSAWTCLAIARETQRQFVFYSVLDDFVAADRRPQIGEFVTRANWTLAMGNFETDLGTGEVRFKTSIDVGDQELTPALAQRVVYANVLNMDRYLPGLQAVAAGDMVPAAAVQMAEGG